MWLLGWHTPRISWLKRLYCIDVRDPESDCRRRWMRWDKESYNALSEYICPWNSPGQNTWVGSLSLLQRIFPTQESNRGLLHCRWILYQLSYQEAQQHEVTIYNSWFLAPPAEGVKKPWYPTVLSTLSAYIVLSRCLPCPRHRVLCSCLCGHRES